MSTLIKEKNEINIEALNNDVALFDAVHPITRGMKLTHNGVSRLVMLDRYSFKDTEKKTLKLGDFVILTVKSDPEFPARGLGFIKSINWEENEVKITVHDDYVSIIDKEDEVSPGVVNRSIDTIDKPLEVYYEQIARRNATGLSAVEETKKKYDESFDAFTEELDARNFVPAGRVLYGAGSNTDVTYFNCYVMPYGQDSREGISDHRKQVMEIMSRGGGVGTNGSTLRPRHTLARGVNGKSSGSVSWLDDIAKLTHLVEQGGSRRGAQMIMLVDSHPDIIEFIISKMQNPRILRYLIENTKDKQIRELAKEKLHFEPLSSMERDMYEEIVQYSDIGVKFSEEVYKNAVEKLKDGGTYSVHNPDFLTGANISVCLTDKFMKAVEKDTYYELKFPDVENYTEEEMKVYNEKWHEVGDVREWKKLGFGIKTYRTIKARELWEL